MAKTTVVDRNTNSNALISIPSSICDFNFESGARQHKYREGQYVFSNDELEQDREDIKHAMIVDLRGGKLHVSPNGDHLQANIDLGIGTGIWCMDSWDHVSSASIIRLPENGQWVMNILPGKFWTRISGPYNLFGFPKRPVHSREC